MKKFAVEILFLVALGLIIQCLTTSWSAVWLAGYQWFDGTVNLITLLYMIACTIGFASFGVVLCVQAQKHLNKWYGLPAVEDAVEEAMKQYTKIWETTKKSLIKRIQELLESNECLANIGDDMTRKYLAEVEISKSLGIAKDELEELAATRMTDIEMLTARIKELEAQLSMTGKTPQQ